MTAVLPLPADVEAWLASLRKKDRHEVRRKVRRFTEEYGAPELVRGTDDSAFDGFREALALSGMSADSLLAAEEEKLERRKQEPGGDS